ncbi:MFS transporter [Streptomyces sp. bgisy084]|uniref:MFS transporter n=1 Tax=Streptomyces sp. bgisy084 TaxID=3413777 RepID=UPI003D764085
MDASGSVAHLVSRRYAWGVALMVVALAVTDYIDRQLVVSTFPYLKKEWGLSDTALGALVTTVSVTIAVFALPAARLADRWGRVKTIAAMGSAWSLAALACAVSGNYAQLFAARSLLGVGEAGYGPAGAALLSGYFPQRLRATVLSVFQAAGPLGAVLGVLFGGVMAGQFGWRVTLGAFTAPAAVIDVVHPSVRATAVGMAALVQNLFGLAVGPVLTGLLSDAFGLGPALALMPLFCLAAGAAFWLGSRSYEKDLAAASGGVPEATPPGTHERELRA